MEELLSKKADLSYDLAIKRVGTIHGTVRRIARIVQSLLTFSRDSKNDSFMSTQLKTVVDETLTLCEQRLKEREIRLELSPISEDLYVQGRPSQLIQVLLNLIQNACDAVDSLPEKWIRIEIEMDGVDVCLNVIDSGRGIPVSLRDRIFDPFFTTKDVGKGTGLGLSISKSIIEEHKGQLIVDQQRDHTCFKVRLPGA